MLLSAGCAASTESFRLRIRTLSDAYALTVLTSRLVLRIPRAGLTHERRTPSGSADTSRSFVFRDDSRALIVSGWFESARRFRGTRAHWDDVVRDWRQQDLPAPENVSFRRVNRWDVILYEIPIPGSTHSHVQAHWVEAGTWIDLHLALLSQRPRDEQRAILLRVLESLQVREKT